MMFDSAAAMRCLKMIERLSIFAEANRLPILRRYRVLARKVVSHRCQVCFFVLEEGTKV